MIEEKEEKNILYYLNPITWGRLCISYLLTGALILNHFFVFILMGLIILLVAFFSYDRYALMTYDEDYSLAYSHGFSSTRKYNSPLVRGDKYLAKELKAYYTSTSPKKHSEKSGNNQTGAFDDKYVFQKSQPVWNRKETVSRSFIYQEVRQRLFNIEINVMQNQNKKAE